MVVLSTITSPVFSELVIAIEPYAATQLPSATKLFETLHTMNEVRSFKLVFLFVEPDLFGGRHDGDWRER